MAQSKIDKALQKGENALARLEKMKERAAQTAQEVTGTAINFGSGMLGGYTRGRMEDAAGDWEYFGVEPELATGGLLVVGSFANLFGDANRNVMEIGRGLLTGWGHNFALTRGREMKGRGMVLGAEEPDYMIGAHDAHDATGIPVSDSADQELAANLYQQF